MERSIGLCYRPRSTLSTNFDRLRHFLSPIINSLPLAVALIVCCLFSGCQTLAPFSQTMRTRVAAARQWSGNGIDAIRRGAVREARECFTKASSQMPHDQEIVANVARTHFQEGEIQQAIDVMRQAVDIKRDDPELMVELGEYCLAAGQHGEAQLAVEKSLAHNHRLAPAWLLKGKLHAANGEHQAALSDFQKSLGIDSSCQDARLQIVQTYRKIGDPLRALSAVEQLLEKFPIDRQPEAAVIEKSAALVQLKQHDSAIEVLTQAIAQNDVSSDTFTALAQIQILAGKKTKAWQTLVQAKERFPNQPQITQFMSEISVDNSLKIASKQ